MDIEKKVVKKMKDTIKPGFRKERIGELYALVKKGDVVRVSIPSDAGIGTKRLIVEGIVLEKYTETFLVEYKTKRGNKFKTACAYKDLLSEKDTMPIVALKKAQ